MVVVSSTRTSGGWEFALQSQLSAAKAVIQAVAPGMRKRRYGRVLVVTVGVTGREGSEALLGVFNALVATWGVDLGGHGLTCNSLNLTLEAGNQSPEPRDAECLIGPALMLVGPAGAGVNGAALPVHPSRRV